MRMTWEEALEHVGELMPAEVEQRALRSIPHYIWMERGHPGALGWPEELMEPGEETGRRGRKKPPLVGFCTNCLMWHDLDRSREPDWVANDPYVTDEYGDDPGFDAPRTFQSGTEAKGKIAHGRIGHCPGCGARAQYRYLSIGYKSLRDRNLLIIYSKSAIDKDALVCVGYYISVGWRDMDPCETLYPPMDISPVELCVFRYGKGADRFIASSYGCWDKDGHLVRSWVEWKHRKECKSGWVPGAAFWGAPNVRVVLDRESLEAAIDGTRFHWVLDRFDTPIEASCKSWDYFDKITVLAKVARYPCIEYLYKLGHHYLADYAIDHAAGDLLYLRGKTAKAVLRLTDQQWGEVKGKKLEVTHWMLRAVQYSNREKLKWSMDLCAWIGRQDSGALDRIKDIRTEFGKLDLVGALKYCRRKSLRLYDYHDYLRQLKTLRMNMADKTVLYPKDFGEMHTRLSARIKAKANKGLQKKLDSRLPKLTEYCFSALGLVLRPMLSAGEVIAEGTALHHCVGGYVDRYVKGQIVLCCVRTEEALGIPLYTVEFDGSGRLVQCRGERNQTRPEDVDRLKLFWQLFEQMRADLKAREAKEQKKASRRGGQAERKSA